MGRRVGGLAVAGGAVLALCLVVTLLFWPQRTAHADRPARSAVRLASVGTTDGAGFAVVAHRGYPGRGVTENTLPAFRQALTHGATAIELDVQLTRDGRLLVLHDPTLDRTTTCRGRVERRTLARLQERCRGRRGGERLPSLGQVLDLAVRRDAHVVVDLKRRPSVWSPTRYARLVGAIRSRGLEDRTVVLGYHRTYLEAVRALDPALRVQGIVDDLAEVARMREWADGVNLPATAATADLVADLRTQGLLVLGRKTGAETSWALLRDAGVDGLLTSRVEAYRTWSTASTPMPTEPPAM